MKHINSIDLKIANTLDQKGRASNREIARQLGVAQTTVKNRLSHMFDDDILKISALFDMDKLPELFIAFIGIQLNNNPKRSAAEIKKTKVIAVSGGVAANSALRRRLEQRCQELGYRLYYPAPNLCTDNAAMIASVGYDLLSEGENLGLSLNTDAFKRSSASHWFGQSSA